MNKNAKLSFFPKDNNIQLSYPFSKLPGFGIICQKTRKNFLKD
jgi:hypothetical protein